MSEASDLRVLLRKLKDGDLSAFDGIYGLTKKSVYYTAYAVFRDTHVAEDIMQETYVAFLEKKDKLKDDVDLPAYLVTMAKNRSYDLYMKRKKEMELEDELVGGEKEHPHDSGLVAAIRRILSPKEAEIFLLRVLGDYSFKEISKMKGIPVGTLTWTYQEARKKLERELGEIR